MVPRFREVEAIRNSDSTGSTDYLKKQKAFLETHLGTWMPEFAENVEAGAQTEFYQNLARLTRSFIKEDLNYISGHLIPSNISVR